MSRWSGMWFVGLALMVGAIVATPADAATTLQVTLGGGSGQPGQDVMVTLQQTSQPIRGVAVLSMEIAYDSSKLTFKSYDSESPRPKGRGFSSPVA